MESAIELLNNSDFTLYTQKSKKSSNMSLFWLLIAILEKQKNGPFEPVFKLTKYPLVFIHILHLEEDVPANKSANHATYQIQRKNIADDADNACIKH